MCSFLASLILCISHLICIIKERFVCLEGLWGKNFKKRDLLEIFESGTENLQTS